MPYLFNAVLSASLLSFSLHLSAQSIVDPSNRTGNNTDPLIALVGVTSSLTYDFSTGQLSAPSTDVIVRKYTRKKNNRYRLSGIPEGSGIAVTITNLNPLKYSGNVTSVYATTSTAPPVLNATNISALFTPSPTTTPNSPPPATTSPEIGSTRPIASQAAAIQDNVNCIATKINELKLIQEKVQRLAAVFSSFENYYNNQASVSDNLTRTQLDSDMQTLVITPVSAINWAAHGITFVVNSAVDVNKASLKALQLAIERKIDQLNSEITPCYSSLMKLAFSNPSDFPAAERSLRASGTADPLTLTLSQLPQTHSQIVPVIQWSAGLKNFFIQSWTDIDRSLVLLEHSRTANFSQVVGTVMADEDLVVLSISVKNAKTGAEVRKIDNIKVYCTGGVRVDYGVGLYVTGLSDRQYIVERSTKIERVAIIKDQTTIDSIYQSVNYSRLRPAKRDLANWGSMGFIQVRSNFNSYVNVGAYMGLGLLLNNNAKPIYSTGVSFVLGKIPRVNLNAGVVWGKVDRINPKYTADTQYRSDITDATTAVTRNAFIFGLTWRIGTIKKN